MDVLDITTLDQLRGLQDEGEEDLLVELIDLFVADVPARLAALGEAVRVSDWRAVSERAHSLKGSSASLGAVRMADLCAQLEATGHDVGTRAAAGALFAALESHFQVVCEALRRERDAPH